MVRSFSPVRPQSSDKGLTLASRISDAWKGIGGSGGGVGELLGSVYLPSNVSNVNTGYAGYKSAFILDAPVRVDGVGVLAGRSQESTMTAVYFSGSDNDFSLATRVSELDAWGPVGSPAYDEWTVIPLTSPIEVDDWQFIWYTSDPLDEVLFRASGSADWSLEGGISDVKSTARRDDGDGSWLGSSWWFGFQLYGEVI